MQTCLIHPFTLLTVMSLCQAAPQTHHETQRHIRNPRRLDRLGAREAETFMLTCWTEQYTDDELFLQPSRQYIQHRRITG